MAADHVDSLANLSLFSRQSETYQVYLYNHHEFSFSECLKPKYKEILIEIRAKRDHSNGRSIAIQESIARLWKALHMTFYLDLSLLLATSKAKALGKANAST